MSFGIKSGEIIIKYLIRRFKCSNKYTSKNGYKYVIKNHYDTFIK